LSATSVFVADDDDDDNTPTLAQRQKKKRAHFDDDNNNAGVTTKSNKRHCDYAAHVHIVEFEGQTYHIPVQADYSPKQHYFDRLLPDDEMDQIKKDYVHSQLNKLNKARKEFAEAWNNYLGAFVAQNYKRAYYYNQAVVKLLGYVITLKTLFEPTLLADRTPVTDQVQIRNDINRCIIGCNHAKAPKHVLASTDRFYAPDMLAVGTGSDTLYHVILSDDASAFVSYKTDAFRRYWMWSYLTAKFDIDCLNDNDAKVCVDFFRAYLNVQSDPTASDWVDALEYEVNKYSGSLLGVHLMHIILLNGDYDDIDKFNRDPERPFFPSFQPSWLTAENTSAY
jgi:hypothetical protein